MSFAEATAVTEVGEGRYTAVVPPRWDIAGHANGGYLLALAARAALDASGRDDPVTATAHFLNPVPSGPVSLRTRVLKSGRRFTTVDSTISSNDGTPLVTTLGSYGTHADTDGPRRLESGPPDLPPVERCVRLQPTETFPPPFIGQVELHLHPDDVPFGSERGSGHLRVRGWFRWPDGEPPLDTLTLLVAADAFPPTSFNADLPVAWTPTIELTTHVRARPRPGWLRCSFSTRFVSDGFLEEDGELWDESGRLVAQSRQLALVPLD